MKIESFCYNSREELAANTYVVYDNGKAIVIDPSSDYDGIINFLEEHKLKLEYVLLTHGHFDHLKGLNRLLKRYNIPYYCHFSEEELMYDPKLNCSENFNSEIIIKQKPILVSDGDEIKFGETTIRVIHTPFHTLGSVCYFFIKEKVLFSGDTIFKLTIGRDDLATSCPRYKHDSLNKLKLLPKDLKIYPGHGPSTTLDYELTFNRFFNR